MSTRNHGPALRDHRPQLTQTDGGERGLKVPSVGRDRFTGEQIWRTLGLDGPG
ncbi:MAG TPA: hypothetical protein VFA46_22865 [Actinomycetes bacterium]|nr:hypothetical protein [Actinomycetes bacterium]